MQSSIGDLIGYLPTQEPPPTPYQVHQSPCRQPDVSLQLFPYQRIGWLPRTLSEARVWLTKIHAEIAAAEHLLDQHQGQRGEQWERTARRRLELLEDRAKELAETLAG